MKYDQKGSESRKEKVDKKRKGDNNLLEEAIMTWPAAEQREFFLRHGKPSWGIKGIMAQRML